VLCCPTTSRLWRFIVSCAISTDVAIRIENASEKDFDGVVVKFPEQRENYGRIPAASVSSYRTVTKAYPSAFVEITLGDEVAVVQPIDFFGVPLLQPGRYTYRFTLNANSRSRYDRVRLELVVDK
jgi:hypothetical protein